MQQALWIIAAAAAADIELGCLAMALLANFHVIPPVDIPRLCWSREFWQHNPNTT
jgi:hypothetical protein